MAQTVLAITGFAFKMPQEAVDEDSLWKVLEEGRNLQTDWPFDRGNVGSYYDNNSGKPGTTSTSRAHFIAGDPSTFDAPFFAITSKEAQVMDPQQRWALQIAYQAFESAGMSMKSLSGSQTAVFAGTMMGDYGTMMFKDVDRAPRTTITGNDVSMIPNRISWFFNLQGPSVQVNTACSSSMVALSEACQSLQSGDASSALVIGSSLLLDPQTSVVLSNMNFLSPDGLSYSFDYRANGYARGEGIVGLVVRPLEAALKDNCAIRALIRGIGCNQDGRTPTLTQPSGSAQERLIRHVYHKAALGFQDTGYVEAHGTGTSVGDPIEAKAIGSVFRPFRSNQDPLYIGSIKANVGHLEGASALAGVVKAILSIERAKIPPAALFKAINPAIDTEFYNIAIPTKCLPWPRPGVRRVSVNSFGQGGTNGHVILDDAFHYLENKCASELQTNHRLWASTDHCAVAIPQDGATDVGGTTGADLVMERVDNQSLLVWSAPDSRAASRLTNVYKRYYQQKVMGNAQKLEDLAYTLSERRSFFPWRSFMVVNPSKELSEQPKPVSPIRESSSPLGIALIFTGQGAQYLQMGAQLLQYTVFKDALDDAQTCFTTLGAVWSLFDILNDPELVHVPEFCQPVCTALQIGLFELLKSFGVVPSIVLGHSSGEIAAAYAAGGLSLNSACKVAFYRGLMAQKLLSMNHEQPGAMLAVNLSALEASKYCTANIVVACINSATNCTLSGNADEIDEIYHLLKNQEVFAQKVNTGVAYHSPAVGIVSEEYKHLLGRLDHGPESTRVSMISSLTGEALEDFSILTTPQYWADNGVSPVQFSLALQQLLAVRIGSEKSITDIIEVGPHSALRRPVQDEILWAQKRLGLDSPVPDSARYHSVLVRGSSSLSTTLNLIGSLFCRGYQVNIMASNSYGRSSNEGIQYARSPKLVVDCPLYPFDDSRKYWTESRTSKDARYRDTTVGLLLGKPSIDWSPLLPKFRNWLSLETMPWLGDHRVGDKVLFPGSGMIVMSLEAVKQVLYLGNYATVESILFRDVHFISPITIPKNADDATETSLCVRPLHEKEARAYEVTILAFQDQRWAECFRADVQAQYGQAGTPVDNGQEDDLFKQSITRAIYDGRPACASSVDTSGFYSHLSDHGLSYGPSFQLIQNQRWDRGVVATAEVIACPAAEPAQRVAAHPAVMDAAFHILFTQISKAMTTSLPTFVPRRLRNLWISSEAWRLPSTPLQVLSVLRNNKRSTAEGTIYAAKDDNTPIFSIALATLAAVSFNNEGGQTAGVHELIYKINRKPLLSGLSQEKLQQLCGPYVVSNLEEKSDIILQDEVALGHASRYALSRLEELRFDILSLPSHLQQWISSLSRSVSADSPLSFQQVSKLLDEVELRNPSVKCCVDVARNMEALMKNEMDPLELIITSGSAEILYERLFEELCSLSFNRFLDLASHQTPSLKILEIGAGTGGMTKHVLTTLRQLEIATGTTHFLDYVYTDISPAFFAKAQTKFSDVLSRLQFKKLDITQNPANQGFDLGAYDLVIAASVLHATPDLKQSLANVRSLIKPGGHFVLVEMTNVDSLMGLVGFGSLSGWWTSTEQWRQKGPLVTDDIWENLVKASGFSGRELFSGIPSGASLLVTKALPLNDRGSQQTIEPAARRFVILTDSEICQTNNSVVAQIAEMGESVVFDFATMDDAKTTVLKNDIVVSLLELGSCFLAIMGDKRFTKLRNVIQQTQNLLWVAGCITPASANPRFGLATGFLRTIRAEEPTKRIITLNLESMDSDEKLSSIISHILSDSFSVENTQPQETEFIVRDNILLVDRLVHDISSIEAVISQTTPSVEIKSWSEAPPVSLFVQSVGMLDTIQYAEDKTYVSGTVGPEEVEIETRAWPLSFRDVLNALGRLEYADMGYECAGVVTQVGSRVHNLQVGDRVCTNVIGSMRTYVRNVQHEVYKIPDDVSFARASSAMNPGMTAWHGLVNLARLQKNEKILIHSAAGSTGQMAICIAQHIGAEIFATVGYDDKKQFLIDEFGLLEDHIFYSRNASFAKGVMRMTDYRGVDVVLNSLSGEGMRASWECVAPFGRFIEIGKADIMSNAPLPMEMFAKNVSFAAIDLGHIEFDKHGLAQELALSLMRFIAENNLSSYPKPQVTFRANEAEKAFRYIQSGKNIGRAILTFEPCDKIPKVLTRTPTWRFRSDASYIVAGGLGGIGRAVIRWMVRKGAKNFIVPSRSGAVSNQAKELVLELEAARNCIVTPQCDVADAEMLSRTLHQYSFMPPIKGCLNCTMDLQDAVFEGMVYTQWEATIRSKVQSSWNLHEQLPVDMDFYILLSSLSGVYGSLAQSNYAAGSTFQDSLATYRSSLGKKTLSLDLGVLLDVGIVSEREDYQKSHNQSMHMKGMNSTMLMSILDHFCDPDFQVSVPDESQVLLGVMTTVESSQNGLAVSRVAGRQLFAGFAHIPSEESAESVPKSGVDIARLFKHASTVEERSAIVVAAIIDKLASALSISTGDVDARKPLSGYGVDSLMAVELRNWIQRDFNVLIAVFDMIGGETSISSIGASVAQESLEIRSS